MTLQDADAIQGSISFGTGSTVTATQSSGSLGNVYIVVGDIPNTPTVGTTSTNVSVNPTSGGQVFFGSAGITATSTNTVNAPGTIVVFSAPSSSQISMNGNVTINQSSGPPIITDLDLGSVNGHLDDPSAVNAIETLQELCSSCGSITVTNGVVSGTVILDPQQLASTISADVIPSTVTVTFAGFQTSNAIDITTADQVVIGGTEQFTTNPGGNSEGVININSTYGGGPVLSVQHGGVLSSDGSLTLNANGDMQVSGTIIAGGNLLLSNTVGNITNTATGVIKTTGTSTLTVQVAGSLINNGSVTAPSGNVSVSSSGALSVSGSGTMSVASSGLVSLSGTSVSAAQGTFVGQVAGSASNGSFNLTATSGNLTVAGITSNNGSIYVDLTAAGSTLAVAANAIETATEGNLTLENDGTASSAGISIGSGAQITATTTGNTLGHVYVTMGAVPDFGVLNATPANVTVNDTNGGLVYFGSADITGNGSNNVINTSGSTVVFNTNTFDSSHITLGGNATITADAAPLGPFGPLSSLDLTQQSVTSLIQSMIQTGQQITGTLQVNSSGVATGGNIVIAPEALAQILTAENIPSGVTVTMNGFTPANLINIWLTSTSTTSQVLIYGVEQFTAGSGVVNISSQQPAPVLQINNAAGTAQTGSAAFTLPPMAT